MKTKLILVSAAVAALSASCKEKAPEVKQAEEATAKAVESGAITRGQADAINKQVEKAVDMQEEAKKVINEQLARLDKASTVEEMRSAVKEATKANVDLAVESGMLAKEQADLTLESLDSIDLVPEDQLRAMVEQIKTQLRAAQARTE